MLPREIGRRRNGKQQACEPCRKGKLRCDHSVPFCGRCVRRKTTANCIYHPAPMTQGFRAYPSPTSASSTKSGVQSPDEEKSEEPQVPTQPLPQSKSPTTLFRHPPTSYGTTSFSSIFLDNQEQFGCNVLDLDEESETEKKVFSSMDRRKPSLGLKTLKAFPNHHTCHRLLETFGRIDDTRLPPYMIRTAVNAMWTTFGDALTPPQKEEKLMKILRVLYQNEKLPWPMLCDITKPELFTGMNIRWEVLGIMFAFFGIAFMSLQDWDPIFKTFESENNRRKAAYRMVQSADYCLLNCEATDTVNDLVVMLMLNTSVLESICIGDESQKLGRRYSSLVDTIMAVGLHRLPDTPTVAAKSQYHKRLFALTYNLDKTTSSFNGRPPMLSRHYCVHSIPLDLNDEQLNSGPEVLAAAVARLDANGFNTDGAIYPITSQRARCYLGVIREKTLEISLGIKAKFSTERIDSILAELESTYAMFPRQIHYGVVVRNHGGIQGIDLHCQALIRLEYLQTRFLLERLRCKRAGGSHQRLFDIAWEMMHVLLGLWFKRDELLRFNVNFDFIIVAHGIPSSGMLCLAAMKTIKCRQKSANNPSSTNDPTAPPPSSQSSTLDLPGSCQVPISISIPSTIQALTHFIAFLSWIRPTDGNYSLCRRLRTVIQRIVNYLIDPDMGCEADERPKDRLAKEHSINFPSSQSSAPESRIVFPGGLSTVPSSQESNTSRMSMLSSGSAALNVVSQLGSDQDSTPTQTTTQTMSQMGGIDFGMSMQGEGDFGLPFDEMGCLDYLSTVDWTQGGWMDGAGWDGGVIGEEVAGATNIGFSGSQGAGWTWG